jgi:uncharacterized membrane protein
MIIGWPLRLWRSLSAIGLVLGTLFFAAALTPSLVPRSYLIQGLLSGFSFSAGYAIGVLIRSLWRYLELPAPTERLVSLTKLVAAPLCAVVAIAFLWKSAGWQDSIRGLMGLPPLADSHSLQVCFIAVMVFLVALALARLFLAVFGLTFRRSARLLPTRIANLMGVIVAALVLWLLVKDVALRAVLTLLDSSYRQYDALIEPERPQPPSPEKTGSAASLLNWDELGRAGREFIASATTAEEIGAFTGKPSMEPIRVYAGLRSAETAAARAKLALEELKRVGAFERAALVVITPTGTGWVDPAAMTGLEYLQNGNVASVAQQYSYLSSPLSLLIEPDYASQAARALFVEVYGYWTTLPKDRRPKFYLHGLSLGSMNSEKSTQLFEIFEDPIQGALWAGPPFPSSTWRRVTDARNAGAPAWLPEFRNGSLVRFMNQNGSPVPADAPWGSLRIVYLQYSSDPIVFFDYRDAYRKPAWMTVPRGPDVSPSLRWYPVVTMLQLGFDLLIATGTPMGYGHVYAPDDYTEAWRQVLDRRDWSDEEIARLKQHLTTLLNAPEIAPVQDNRGG